MKPLEPITSLHLHRTQQWLLRGLTKKGWRRGGKERRGKALTKLQDVHPNRQDYRANWGKDTYINVNDLTTVAKWVKLKDEGGVVGPF